MKKIALRFSTVLILTASFTVISGVLLVGQNLQRILTLWGESLQMTVYLAENTSPEVTEQIATSLKNNDKLDKIQFVSNETALSQFRDQMASYAPNFLKDPDLLKSIPASFQFSLSSSIPVKDQPLVMQDLAVSLKTLPGVDQVSYGQEWVKNYVQISSVINGIGLVVTAIIVLSALFVISNCLRSAVHQRRDEIEVLELIGATARYIRRPFLVEGLVLCGSSCVLGLLFAFGVYSATVHGMKSQLSLLQLSQHILFLRGDTIILLWAGSLAVGWLSTRMCLDGLNDGWAASQKSQAQES